jgi:hypothetical protein
LRKRGANSDVENDSGGGSDRQEDGPRGTDGPYRPPWESILGLPVDVWEKLLSPSPSWHKRRFEVGINDLAFVGWPVFVRGDGAWKKQKRKKKKGKQRTEWEGAEIGHNEATEDSQDDDGEAIAASTETLSPHSIPQKAQRPSVSSNRSSKVAGDDTDDKDSMTMFNVVFVLDPPLLEHSTRIREIYDNIIKKFIKALKYEQARTNYVWKESQHILHLKEKAKEKSTPLKSRVPERS